MRRKPSPYTTLYSTLPLGYSTRSQVGYSPRRCFSPYSFTPLGYSMRSLFGVECAGMNFSVFIVDASHVAVALGVDGNVVLNPLHGYPYSAKMRRLDSSRSMSPGGDRTKRPGRAAREEAVS